ncbi:hypothetical protein P171DRAFT_486784 [Karstenula rhodostoma CBS 690.94]|uniref:Uncharacterized protein n=1 Tax=Karstenula rhodostoma CBS 690.94 TaxID=1392251 RepID=A0A9P4UB65_9PLEO|nr:hypothetical protein P171DRAFT_486784 [Karstenula rhodostoma CBS 690.94]
MSKVAVNYGSRLTRLASRRAATERQPQDWCFVAEKYLQQREASGLASGCSVRWAKTWVGLGQRRVDGGRNCCRNDSNRTPAHQHTSSSAHPSLAGDGSGLTTEQKDEQMARGTNAFGPPTDKAPATLYPAIAIATSQHPASNQPATSHATSLCATPRRLPRRRQRRNVAKLANEHADQSVTHRRIVHWADQRHHLSNGRRHQLMSPKRQLRNMLGASSSTGLAGHDTC